MPIPEDDVVCRFVRSKDWSTAEQRPKPGAFKDVNLSVWHLDRLETQGARPEDLLFKSLLGAGQAHYCVGDFSRIAQQVEAKAQHNGEPGQLDITVEWSLETVVDEWKQWAPAHIEVRTETDCRKLWAAFRRALCTNARAVVPPP